jgi:hypothetical protein
MGTDPLATGIDDDGESFVALLASRKATKGLRQAIMLVEHFRDLARESGAKIYLRSWAPTEKGTHPRCLVRFKGERSRQTVGGLCEIRPTGRITLTAAAIKRNSPVAYQDVIAAGVAHDAEQRGYDATPELLEALSRAAAESASHVIGK